MKLRRIELLRAGWGAVLLNRIHGVHVDRKAAVVTRVLGARHLVQALVSGLDPSSVMLAAGV
ncbi:hypothetical protein A4G29_18320 [Mycobacterium kansasii]|nr:hypothetical protein A4G29_18320 [Mycobacterium kansasii]